MSYIHCPNCNQKALSVATRCPRCGVAFETRPSPAMPGAGRRRSHPALLALGTVLVLVIANAIRLQFGSAGGLTPPSPTARNVPPPRPVATRPEPTRPSGDSAATPKAPSPAPATRAPSATPTGPQSPAPTVVSAPPAAPRPDAVPTAPAVRAPAPRPAPPADDDGALSRRYASTWVNLRTRPRPAAAVVRVLAPGEAVLVDTVERGWYRVVADGEEIGYVDQRLLDTARPIRP